jgi:hypothetical protein
MQPEIPVGNNKMMWKMKIPLKAKIISWYLIVDPNQRQSCEKKLARE